MNNKKCSLCMSLEVVKNGKQKGVQRWFCKICKKKFRANRKLLPSKEELFCLFAFNKQTLTELKESYHLRRTSLQNMIYGVSFKRKEHTPREIHLSVDTTFFEDFAVVVFRDAYQKENLYWKFIDTEKLFYYQEGKQYLERLGYKILSVTADGLIGLPLVFKGIPFQYCHFHAKKTIIKYVTKKPKTIAGKEILDLIYNLKNFNKDSFVYEIDNWFLKHKFFLKEKTVHPSGSWSYTHKNLRSVLKSLQHMSQYLFHYQLNKNIPGTTNTLEGFFSHLKLRIRVHRGLSKDHKQKVIHGILLNSSVCFNKEVWKKIF